MLVLLSAAYAVGIGGGEVARKLKENGFSIADIVRIAGLSPEEIDKL